MMIIGLTGSIGMGKSATARVLQRLYKIPVHDSDRCVKQLTAKGGKALAPIADVFPDVVTGGELNRSKLGQHVFENRQARLQLEAILHPMVQDASYRFLRHHGRNRRAAVCLDIPLLFETSVQRRCSWILVVDAPAFIQKQRVLARPGMTSSRLRAVRHNQMPQSIKCRRADAVLPTGLGHGFAVRRLRRIMKHVRSLRRHRHVWPPNMFRLRRDRIRSC